MFSSFAQAGSKSASKREQARVALRNNRLLKNESINRHLLFQRGHMGGVPIISTLGP